MPLLIVGGRSFYAVAAVAGKARSPSVVRRVDGTTSDQYYCWYRWSCLETIDFCICFI